MLSDMRRPNAAQPSRGDLVRKRGRAVRREDGDARGVLTVRQPGRAAVEQHCPPQALGERLRHRFHARRVSGRKRRAIRSAQQRQRAPRRPAIDERRA
jgi:hypothetical protein